MPLAAFIAASLLSGIGLNAPRQWIGTSSVAILAVSVSLFVGIPVAFVLNVWRIGRVGVRLQDGEMEGLLALEFAPLHLIVIAIAFVIGGLFVGHLAADSYACMHGIRTAC